MDIVSMSFGGKLESEILHNVIKKAEDKGIILIAAAGNDGSVENKLLYPAQYPEVISVGAIGMDLKRASFSNVGSELDLVAPGIDILRTTNDDEYGTMSGTSMAVPHVTGATALLMSKNKKYTSKDVMNKLYSTATVIGEQKEYGHGVINLSKALGLSDREIVAPHVDPVVLTKEPIDSYINFEVKEYDLVLKG
jgi:subtilisin family serine protease